MVVESELHEGSGESLGHQKTRYLPLPETAMARAGYHRIEPRHAGYDEKLCRRCQQRGPILLGPRRSVGNSGAIAV